jgi:hypothetical protein
LVEATVVFGSQSTGWNGSANVSTSPTGSAGLRMQDAFLGQTSASPTGPDGLADDGAVADGQMAGVVDQLHLHSGGSAVLGSGSVVLSQTAVFDNGIFGDVGPIHTPITLAITPTMLLQNLHYLQVGPAGMGSQVEINPNYADGAHPGVAGALNLSTRYPSIVSEGTLSADAELRQNVLLTLDFGDLGSFQKSYGPFSSLGSFGADAQWQGSNDFIELSTALDPSFVDALLQTFSGELLSASGPLTIPIALAGSFSVNELFEMPLDFGFLGVTTSDARFQGSFQYTFNATLTISQASLELTSNQIYEAVNVPEAHGIGLGALATLGGLATAWRRGRLTIFRRSGTIETSFTTKVKADGFTR